MTTHKDSWFDLSSLRLADSGWEHGSTGLTFESESGGEGTLYEFGPQGRYIDGLRVWMSEGAWRVEVSPKGDPRIACRGLGQVLDRLVEEVGAEHLPPKLFFEARKSLFLARGLLSLQPLNSAKARQEIIRHHTLESCRQEAEEGFKAYEGRAVEQVASELQGYEEQDPGALRLEEVRSTPDGLFYNEGEGHLVIVEAKMNKADWSDGAAQVLQYLSQARNHSRFCQARMSTTLVVAESEPSDSYRRWEDLMRLDRDFDIYIDGASLAFPCAQVRQPKLRSA